MSSNPPGYDAAYYEAHKARMRKQRRKYYYDHREARLIWQKEYEQRKRAERALVPAELVSEDVSRVSRASVRNTRNQPALKRTKQPTPKKSGGAVPKLSRKPTSRRSKPKARVPASSPEVVSGVD